MLSVPLCIKSKDLGLVDLDMLAMDMDECKHGKLDSHFLVK